MKLHLEYRAVAYACYYSDFVYTAADACSGIYYFVDCSEIYRYSRTLFTGDYLLDIDCLDHAVVLIIYHLLTKL